MTNTPTETRKEHEMSRPVAATFHEMKGLIRSECNRHQRMRGGDLEELMSEAQSLFMDAYASYDAARGAFTTWLVTVLRRGFNTVARTIARRGAKLGERVILDVVPDRDRVSTPFSMDSFLEPLSDDGRHVVTMVLEADELLDVVHAKHNRDDGSRWRSVLRLQLKDQGWSRSRIVKTFTEISEYLTRLETE